jgi:hypothetical protein
MLLFYHKERRKGDRNNDKMGKYTRWERNMGERGEGDKNMKAEKEKKKVDEE